MDYYDGVQVILKGRSERLYTQFRDGNNVLTDPIGPKVQIYNPDGTLFLASTSPTKESTGIWYYIPTIGTSSSVQEGMYSAYWWGQIGGANITMDVPQYFWVQREPQNAVLKIGEEFVQSVRRFIGDTNPANYRIATQDLRYFIKDAVDEVQAELPMGFVVTVTPASITFNQSLTQTPSSLFRIKTAELIVSHILMDVLFSGASMSLGDIKISMNETIRSRRDYVKDLRDKFAKLIYEIKLNGVFSSGQLIDTYINDNCSMYSIYSDVKNNSNYLR